MAFTSAQVAVSGTVAIVGGGDADGSSAVLVNSGTVGAYLGGSTVSSTTGLLLGGGTALSVDIGAGETLYGTPVSGTVTIHVLQNRVG